MTRDHRRVIANITLSLDGAIHGPAGAHDMGWIVPHAVTDTGRAAMLALTGATTALLGRRNFEGFAGYWPQVATSADAEPRDRAFARWLDEVEKVVFSSMDRLSIHLAPEVVGGGARLFDHPLPASSWTLADVTAGERGALWCLYDRRH